MTGKKKRRENDNSVSVGKGDFFQVKKALNLRWNFVSEK